MKPKRRRNRAGQVTMFVLDAERNVVQYFAAVLVEEVSIDAVRAGEVTLPKPGACDLVCRRVNKEVK